MKELYLKFPFNIICKIYFVTRSIKETPEIDLFGSIGEGLWGDPMKIFMNDRLYELFAGLPCRLESSSGKLNYRLNIVDRCFNKVTQKQSYTPNGRTVPITVDRTILLLSQELTKIALWNPISSLVFASSLLPVIPTNISPKRLWGPRL